MNFANEIVVENDSIILIDEVSVTIVITIFIKHLSFFLGMDKDIGKITKGEFQGTVTDIVVGIREYNGKVGVDIREFVSSEKYTGPTKKGLRIPADSFHKFKEMINSIKDSDLKSSGDGAKSPSKKSSSGDEELPDY